MGQGKTSKGTASPEIAELHECDDFLAKHPEVRYYNVYEDDLDEKQFTKWVKQASKLPGEKM